MFRKRTASLTACKGMDARVAGNLVWPGEGGGAATSRAERRMPGGRRNRDGRKEAGDKGFEPLLTDSESVVLPLHQSPVWIAVRSAPESIRPGWVDQRPRIDFTHGSPAKRNRGRSWCDRPRRVLCCWMVIRPSRCERCADAGHARRRRRTAMPANPASPIHTGAGSGMAVNAPYPSVPMKVAHGSPSS